MAQSMQVHVFPYIDRCKTIPGLENRSRSRSDISLQKSRGGSGNYCFNSLSKEADIEYGLLKRSSQNVSNNRFVLAQVQP